MEKLQARIILLMSFGLLFAQKNEISGIEFLRGVKAQDLKVVAIEKNISAKDTFGFAEGNLSFFFPSLKYYALSPDGKYFADATPSAAQGVMLGKAGEEQNAKRIDERTCQPLWSPDGKCLLYLKWVLISVTPKGKIAETELWVTDLESKNRKPLLPRFEAGFHSWSPNGRFVAMVAHRIPYYNEDGSDTLHYIFVINFETGERITVDSTPIGFDEPCYSWAPDSRKLVYVQTEAFDDELGYPLKSDVYVINADGTKKTRLTYTKEPELSVKWLASGNRILATKCQGGIETLFYLLLGTEK